MRDWAPATGLAIGLFVLGFLLAAIGGVDGGNYVPGAILMILSGLLGIGVGILAGKDE